MTGVVSPDKDGILAPTLVAILGDVSELRPPGPLEGRIVRVEPIAEEHRGGLREAAERDPQIHRFTNLYTPGFDRI